jgi:hypothetical protein
LIQRVFFGALRARAQRSEQGIAAVIHHLYERLGLGVGEEGEESFTLSQHCVDFHVVFYALFLVFLTYKQPLTRWETRSCGLSLLRYELFSLLQVCSPNLSADWGIS